MPPKRVALEAEVLPGLAPFARDELRATGRARPSRGDDGADAVPFEWRGDPSPLHALRTVTSVQRVLRFEVPRPKALLGDAHFRRLSEELASVRAASPEPMRSFRLEAAGRDSNVLRRLRVALAGATGLPDDPDDGELRLRLRRAGAGWELLARLTPRPLSARAWRVCNRPGGLNACVAAAAWRLLGHDPGQRVLNPMCGTGTLLIERAATGPAARLTGLDLDPAAVACAEANRDAAGAVSIEIATGDATRTGLPSGGFDVVVADPPWGDAVSDREGVAALHPAFLAEAARLLAPGGRMLVVTHALRAFEGALRHAADAWEDERTVRVFHGGHRPALRLLRRRP